MCREGHLGGLLVLKGFLEEAYVQRGRSFLEEMALCLDVGKMEM